MFEAIEATDWAAIPGYPKFYDPTAIAPAMRQLADAVSLAQAADAAVRLFDGGLVHTHSAGVHPAAVVAAPILLDIAGHPACQAARPVALGLLDEAMSNYPYDGYTSVTTDDGPDIPLCCAIARTIHTRRAELTALGRPGKELLGEANQHWRFTVGDISPGTQPDSVLALGTLEGRPAHPPQVCDMRYPNRPVIRTTATAELAWTTEATSTEACLLLRGINPEQLPPTTTLWPPCSDRVH